MPLRSTAGKSIDIELLGVFFVLFSLCFIFCLSLPLLKCELD